MTDAENPDALRKLIIERLVGDTGDPRKVVEAARLTALRAVPALLEAFREVSPAPVMIDLAEVDIVRLHEARPESDSLDVVAVVPADISPDALTMRLDPPVLSLLVNALFGGDPDIRSTPLDRPPSQIELDVALVVFETFAAALNGSGSRALGLRLPVSNVLAGPRDLNRMVVRDGPGVRVTYSLSVGEDSGFLSAWMPQRVLTETRAPEANLAGGKGAAEWQQRFNDQVLLSKVTLTATVPLRKMSLSALAELREGQVFHLNENARSEARISVRNRAVFTGELGRLGQNYTVRIKASSDARQEVIDGLLGE